MNMTMKKLPLAALVGAGVLALSGPSVAGIADTKHNLGSTAGTDKVNTFSGTGEICVFCHTPHGTNTNASVPLWNRKVAGDGTGNTYNATYTTYDDLGTTTMDGLVAQVGSVSIACLSCHDGQQALDTVLNEPGSGSTVTAYSTDGSWATTGTLDTDGTLSNTSIVNLGTDLTNDHPVGIQYGGGGYTNSGGTQTTDADFCQPDSGTVGAKTVWWVDTEDSGTTQCGTGNGTREKTDMQLYSRNTISANGDDLGTTLGANYEPFVECASCHDPHSTNTTFLRIQNTGSAVCLACHNK